MKYFDHLAIEICMMVFDHLVTDVISLGTICLVSHNWKIITQNSYAWKLLINAYIGKKTPLAMQYVNNALNIHFRSDPIIYVQCVPNDILSNHSKMLLAKKFLFSFLKNNDIKHSVWAYMLGYDDNEEVLTVWNRLISTCNNVQLLKLFQKTFNITADDVRANSALLVACINGHMKVIEYLHKQFNLTIDDARALENGALLMSCKNGEVEVLKYLHKGFGLTIDDVCANHNDALRIACKYGHLLVVKYLHKEFELDAEDASACENYALRMACKGGYLNIVQYLHRKFGLDYDDARASDNYALCWACQKGHRDIVDYLHEEFELTAADANDSMNWLRMNTDKANIDYLCKVFGLIADEI